jgi:hypothetical protein
MTTKRTPLKRPSNPIITDQAVDLYARGVKLMGRKPTPEVERELSDVCFELSLVLGQKPWEPDLLTDCDCKEPPAFLREAERDDWFRARALREQLQLALHRRKKAAREARKAEREAKRVAQQAPPSPPPEQPPPPTA